MALAIEEPGRIPVNDASSGSVNHRTPRAIARRLLIPGAIGLLSGLSAVAHFDPVRGVASLAGVAAVITIALVVLALAVLIRHYAKDRIRPRSRRQWWMEAAIWATIGFGLTYAIPVPVAPTSGMEVAVEPLGKSAPDAPGGEVWFRIAVDNVPVPTESIQHGPGWVDRDGFLVAIGGSQSGIARWRGDGGSAAKLTLIRHPWSGRVRITADGRAHEFDLNAPQDTPPQEWSPRGNDGGIVSVLMPPRNAFQHLVQASDGLLIGLALWLLFEACSHWPSPSPTRTRTFRIGRDTALFALPSFAVSLSLLVLYAPAIMTSDSVDQWQQAGQFRYHDWHPVYHTMAMSLIRGIWDSPAAVAFVQALLLAVATGWLIATARASTRASMMAGWLGAWLCALMPMNAVTSITLWKDVPYTAAMVALTAGALSILMLGRPRLNRPLPFVVALVILLGCMLIRHNGPPTAVAVIGLLALLVRAQRKALIVLGLSSVALFVVLKGPALDALGVQRSNVGFTLYAHHLAAHMAAGEAPASEEERQLTRRIGGDQWNYDCTTVNVTVFDPKFRGDVAGQHSSELLRYWVQHAVKHPKPELVHLACVSSIVWRLTESVDDPLYQSTMAIYNNAGTIRWVYHAPDGPRESSPFPAQAQALGLWMASLDYDLLWRPAIYLLLALFATAVAMVRLQDFRVGIIAVPITIHSFILAGANVAQDLRYQLPVIVVALACAPLLLSARRANGVSAP